MRDEPWSKIFEDYNINNHNFLKEPFYLTAQQIKDSTKNFSKTSEREVRVLCKQDSRESRPNVFINNNLFILPVKNKKYVIVKGEGYIDIPEIKEVDKVYKSKLNFKLDTSLVGNSEMQHLDFAYASSLIRTFIGDESLILTIRGRKYTPPFSFKVGSTIIETESVQTEVDAGYEGKNQVVLIEAKSSSVSNTIIRQLYYPFRQWQYHTKKQVKTLFFAKDDDSYSIWYFTFNEIDNYNSIKLVNSKKFKIVDDF